MVTLISIYFELLMGCPDQEFQVKVDPKLTFLGQNREIGKNREIKKKNSENVILPSFYHKNTHFGQFS